MNVYGYAVRIPLQNAIRDAIKFDLYLILMKTSKKVESESCLRFGFARNKIWVMTNTCMGLFNI